MYKHAHIYLFCFLTLLVSCLPIIVGCTSAGSENSVNITELFNSASNKVTELYAQYKVLKPQIEQIENFLNTLQKNESALKYTNKATTPNARQIKRKALICGLDRVNPGAWNGWDGECPGTILDANRKQGQLASLAYDQIILCTNDQVNAANLIGKVKQLCADMGEGDLLYVYISGHGGQTADTDGDESDTKDEYLCLYDGALSDDIVWSMLCTARTGLRIVMQFDTCNSRTMYRSVNKRKPHDYATPLRTIKRGPCEVFKARLLAVSGCNDGASSYGSDTGGTFTTADYKVFKRDPSASYAQWFAALSAVMPRNQTPYMSEVGESFRDYPAMR